MTPFFLFEDFENYLVSEKRFSEHTVTAYKIDLDQFLAFTEIKNRRDLLEVSPMLIRGWIVSLYDNKIAKKSINRKLSTLRTFFKCGFYYF